MSCSSLRSAHNICVSNCSTNSCPCEPNSAFSFKPLKPCLEILDNGNFTQAQIINIMCQDVANRYDACSLITFQTTLQFMQCMGLTNWPIFSCPVELGLEGDVSFVAATIRGGIATPTNLTVTPIGQYTITINGIPCDADGSAIAIAFADITPIERSQICDTIIPCTLIPITFDDFISCLSLLTFPNISTIANLDLFSISPSFVVGVAQIVNGVFTPIPVAVALPAGVYGIVINGVPCDPVLTVNISV